MNRIDIIKSADRNEVLLNGRNLPTPREWRIEKGDSPVTRVWLAFDVHTCTIYSSIDEFPEHEEHDVDPLDTDPLGLHATHDGL